MLTRQLPLALCLSAWHVRVLLCDSFSPRFSSARYGAAQKIRTVGSCHKNDKENSTESENVALFSSIRGIITTPSNSHLSGKSPKLSQSLPPNKADFYTDQELNDLLHLHTRLSVNKKMQAKTAIVDPVATIPSLHDTVLDTIQNIVQEQSTSTTSSSSISTAKDLSDRDNKQDTTISSSYQITDPMKRILPNIRAIATDVDGTLITSSGHVHPRTQRALRRVVQHVRDGAQLQHFFLATGKTRQGALHSLGRELAELLAPLPGVFIQGLYCVDGENNVIFEQKLPSAILGAAEDLAAQFAGLSLIGYDGDSLIAPRQTSQAHHIHQVHKTWGEPTPKVIETSAAEYTNGFHKLLYMYDDEDELVRVVRPQLEQLARQYGCVVTQSVPNMLELLPPDSGKGYGVAQLCRYLNIADPATQLMAIGDAENDIGMFRMAAWAVAVGNAVPMAKKAADFVMDETNQQGGAGIAMELFGLGQILEQETK